MEGYDLDRKSGTSNLRLSSQDICGCLIMLYRHYRNILALHQLLKEQVDFTQGNDRARVRVVANLPPKYLRCKLSSFRLVHFSQFQVGINSIRKLSSNFASTPQSALG